jgi:hypothetical protein
LYGARVQNEVLFRDSQQFTGRTDCQARAEAALAFHGNASLATLNRGRAEDLNAQSGDAPRVFSLARGQPGQCHARLLAFLMAK